MPPGSDPHDFAPSAQQAAALARRRRRRGERAGLRGGLVDTIEAAEDDGVQVVTATDAIELFPLAEHGEGDDPHFFTDPVRMRAAAEHIAAELGRAGRRRWTRRPSSGRVDAYLAALDALDAEVDDTLWPSCPTADRTLVTNHEVFGYFADRYGFEVLGAIIPGGATLAEPSAADLAELAAADRGRRRAGHLRRDLRHRPAWPTRWRRKAPMSRWSSSTASRSARLGQRRRHLPRADPHERRADRRGPRRDLAELGLMALVPRPLRPRVHAAGAARRDAGRRRVSVVGTWVVLRGLSFLGDALAHGVIPGMALAVLWGFNLTVGALLTRRP